MIKTYLEQAENWKTLEVPSEVQDAIQEYVKSHQDIIHQDICPMHIEHQDNGAWVLWYSTHLGKRYIEDRVSLTVSGKLIQGIKFDWRSI